MLLLATAVWSCRESKPRIEETPFGDVVSFDLDSIRKRGKIILLTENSASTYYLYRNQIRGFDYELARAYAKHLGVKLEVIILDDVDKMFEMLNSGKGDIIASNLTVTPERIRHVAFSTPVYQTRQVLVQRKVYPDNAGTTEILVGDSSQVNLLPVWVHRYSSFYERLLDIEKQTGMDINIQDAPGEISTDDLIRLVDDGSLPATVTDENLALMELASYTEIDVSVPLTGMQNIAWAVRPNAAALLGSLNNWLGMKKTVSKLEATYKSYFSAEQFEPYSKNYDMPPLLPGAISPFDSIFKIHAPLIGWDWRLLTALAYQESRFNPNAVSRSGAFGLMQLMPETAIRFGCDSTPDPECSVAAGAKYLKYLHGFWKKRVPNPTERDKFVLASYNIGQGHVIDAQNLAKELGMADTIWDGNVAEALLLKQQEKYYSMPCVKHGFCHAKEPYHFVGKILALFEHYKSGTKP
jgi:membrane-bound lytic murein transglycosylase F